MLDDSPPISSPKRDAVHGKIAAYSFALICSGFLAFQCQSAERRGQEVSPTTWMPILVFIGMGLGVQINPSDLVQWMKK